MGCHYRVIGVLSDTEFLGTGRDGWDRLLAQVRGNGPSADGLDFIGPVVNGRDRDIARRGPHRHLARVS